MSFGADVKRVLRQLRDLGFEVENRGSGHYGIRREGHLIAIVPFSPSDWRWRKNLRSDIRRATGIDIGK